MHHDLGRSSEDLCGPRGLGGSAGAGAMRGRYTAFLLWGIALLLVLNVRYVIEGAPDAIAFFIGIYDVLDNLGAPDGAAALAACPNNE